MMPIEFDLIVLKEAETFVAYSPELDVSSCGGTIEEAKRNLKTAVRFFLEEAEKIGTINDILIEAGYQKDETNNWKAPRIIATELAEAG